MTESAYLSQQDAAAVCNVSRDTIRRYRRDRKLPNSRTEGGIVEVAVADLVAAGLLDPLAAGEAPESAGRSRSVRDLVVARLELAVASARLEVLGERLEAAGAEIAFLRSLVQKTQAA